MITQRSVGYRWVIWKIFLTECENVQFLIQWNNCSKKILIIIRYCWKQAHDDHTELRVSYKLVFNEYLPSLAFLIAFAWFSTIRYLLICSSWIYPLCLHRFLFLNFNFSSLFLSAPNIFFFSTLKIYLKIRN